MTRWARVGNSQKHKKLPEDATPWEEFWPNQNRNSTNNANETKVKSGRMEKRKLKQEKKFDGKRKKFENPENKNNSKFKNIEQEKGECIQSSSKFSSKEINEGHLSTEAGTELQRLSKKQLKKERKKAKLEQLKNIESNDNNVSNNVESTEVSQTDDKSPNVKDFLGKKKLFMKKLEKKRKENGILLLPAKIERKLYIIKRRLREKGLPPAAIKDIARKERRKEELKFRRSMSTKPCFNCRQIGHLLAECPMPLGNSNQETGICFKCGSAEHTSYKCPEKIEGYPLAKCFVCKEQGHISKDCPKNDHGVYIKGGKCSLCGNVNHLKKDCPTLKKRNDEESDITAYTINEEKSVDAEIIPTDDTRTDVKETIKKRKKAKLVKF
ncbi:zinc finger CCHC domain-containing protein 9-like [Argiope bruennichi]|uniref:zinc finger CCHC domain-containing protein 9-like n=1 Tax=Argiope bruennichi TaxID=94029 RepID=UPI002493E468|nr:zinc finger CCHC domain-containing protein 9-like [Argiope bruennichi]XP_055931657.1 zinc finger CCHC domain-containing protein 9-like [Argiope bruennichi]XP_055931658.1 zinc finger CCHC domain-containing protein 9-like [Argiope bruennichi]